MRIGEILLRASQLTQEGLDEALDWQVLYGGRLGTNLLELRLVTEEQFARALGKQLSCEVAWGELQPELNRLSKTGDWATMASMITDEIVDTFVVSGSPEEIGPRLEERYGDIVQRVSFDTPDRLGGERVARVLQGLRGDRR